jgi:hypothetical protein
VAIEPIPVAQAMRHAETAQTLELAGEMELANGEIELAGQLARLEFQRIYGEQEAAFTNTLPLCRGLG